jgi:DNA-binding transcriptional LysR family regulator
LDHSEGGSSSAHRWDFEIQTLARDPFVLVCHRDAPVGASSSVTWADIDEFPLVRVSTHTGNRMMIDDALGSRRETLKWRYEVQHIASAIAVVRSGMAMAVIPRMALNSAEMTGLRVKELRNPSVSRQIGIVSKRAAPLSALANDLRRLVVKELAARNRAAMGKNAA